MIAKFQADRDPQGLNVKRIDAASVDASAIMNEILAAPFLAEKRMVVVEGCIASKHEALRATLLERIEEKNIPDSTVLLFWEDGTKYKKKEQKAFFERLQKEKFAQEFPALEGAKLAGWVASLVKEKKGTIGRAAVQHMIDATGSDSWQLKSLVEQLVAYASGREITVEDAELFLDKKVDDNIFNLVDNILAKKSSSVFEMMQEQYRSGKDVQYIFAMVLRQVRILLELADLKERGVSASPKELGLHPFVVKKSTALAHKYSVEELSQVYGELLALDSAIKHGQGEPKVLMDVFVGKSSIAC